MVRIFFPRPNRKLRTPEKRRTKKKTKKKTVLFQTLTYHNKTINYQWFPLSSMVWVQSFNFYSLLSFLVQEPFWFLLRWTSSLISFVKSGQFFFFFLSFSSSVVFYVFTDSPLPRGTNPFLPETLRPGIKSKCLFVHSGGVPLLSSSSDLDKHLKF